MARRCSHCSNNGHNSRTCPSRGGGGGGGVGVRIFGVRLAEGVGAMKKSASMGCLSSAATFSNACASLSPDSAKERPANAVAGYASDDAPATSASICRKKGVPWTEEEHLMFLMGLQKLGKGDWRGIARNFVASKTPTQVASHAQKYFIRQSNASKRKRRSSLFDMPIEQIPVHEEHPPNEPNNTNHPTTLQFSKQEGTNFLEASAMNYAPELSESIHPDHKNAIAMVPVIYTAFVPMELPFWTPNSTAIPNEEEMRDSHEIVKPIQAVPKEALNIEEVVGMSKLSIGDGLVCLPHPSALSLKLVESSTSSLPDLNQSSGSPIHAV